MLIVAEFIESIPKITTKQTAAILEYGCQQLDKVVVRKTIYVAPALKCYDKVTADLHNKKPSMTAFYLLFTRIV